VIREGLFISLRPHDIGSPLENPTAAAHTDIASELPKAEAQHLRHAPIGQARHCFHVRERNRQIALLTTLTDNTAHLTQPSRKQPAPIPSATVASRAPACGPTRPDH